MLKELATWLFGKSSGSKSDRRHTPDRRNGKGIAPAGDAAARISKPATIDGLAGARPVVNEKIPNSESRQDFARMKIISGVGQEFELPESVRLQCLFCRDDDGKTYELITTSFKPDVANAYVSQKMRFAKTNPTVIRNFDPREISALYRLSNVGVSKPGDMPIDRARSEFLDIVNYAIHEGANDVHFVVRSGAAKVMIRVHGKIEVTSFSLTRDKATGLLAAMYGEAKDSSDTNFSTRSRSACTLKFNEPPVSLRWQTQPTGDAAGEEFDVVFRATKQDTQDASKVASLSVLGYTEDQVALLSNCCNSKGGIIMSGVTGSGKTTALRSLMEIVRGEGATKIYTVEDPVELKIFGATQINVRGGKMDEVIRSLMRSDPDTIMVGEIRGREVADAMQDVIRSGHKMLTTIHAPSGIGIISRLCSDSIGVDRDTIAEPGFISALVYQYLMPVMCPNCKIPVMSAKDRISEEVAYHLFGESRYNLDPETVYVTNHDGCPSCRKGVSGMTICAEVIRPDDNVLELLRERRDSEALKAYRMTRTHDFRSSNMTGKTSYEAAIYKVSAGMIDPNEVNAMCGSISLEKIERVAYGKI